jgi:hypothetical protein
MRRIVLVPLAAFVLLGLVNDASAQVADAVPEATPPPPSLPAPVPLPARVHVRVKMKKEWDFADVFVERRGIWTSAGQTPCTFDAAPGERVRVDVQGDAEHGLVFTVPDDGTRDHEIEVHRRGDGYFVGGLVAIGAGAVSLALGMAIIRGAGNDDLFGGANRAVAAVMLLLGAGSAVTGAVLILRRSTDPYLVPSTLPSTRTQALEDLAPVRTTRPLESPPFQLSWTTRF